MSQKLEFNSNNFSNLLLKKAFILKLYKVDMLKIHGPKAFLEIAQLWIKLSNNGLVFTTCN